jgi:hypothetical protein
MTTNPLDVPPPPERYEYAAQPAPRDASRPRWSAGRTAVVAGVTVVLVSAGAVGAAAALPLGGTDRGGAGSQGGFPGGGQFQRFRNGFGPQQNGQDGFGQQQNGAQLPVVPVVPGFGGTGHDTGSDDATT